MEANPCAPQDLHAALTPHQQASADRRDAGAGPGDVSTAGSSDSSDAARTEEDLYKTMSIARSVALAYKNAMDLERWTGTVTTHAANHLDE